MAIICSDYKGKWFVLEDGDPAHNECPEVNLEYVLGVGLSDHVENCRYYGIPAYIGSDSALNEKIAAINAALDAQEAAATEPNASGEERATQPPHIQ